MKRKRVCVGGYVCSMAHTPKGEVPLCEACLLHRSPPLGTRSPQGAYSSFQAPPFQIMLQGARALEFPAETAYSPFLGPAQPFLLAATLTGS